MSKTTVCTNPTATNGAMQTGKTARKTGQVSQEIMAQDYDGGPIYRATIIVDYTITVSPDFDCMQNERLLGMRRMHVPIKIDRSPEELCANIAGNIEARLEDHHDFNPLLGDGFFNEDVHILIPSRMFRKDECYWEFLRYETHDTPDWCPEGLPGITICIHWATGRNQPWGQAAIWTEPDTNNKSCLLFESLSSEYEHQENEKTRERTFRLTIPMRRAIEILFKGKRVDVPSRILVKYAKLIPPKKPKKKPARRQ